MLSTLSLVMLLLFVGPFVPVLAFERGAFSQLSWYNFRVTLTLSKC